MSVKDDAELACIQHACNFSSRILQVVALEKVKEFIEDGVDDGIAVTHKELSRELERVMKNPSEIPIPARGKAWVDYVDIHCKPTIQSGGDYSIDKIISQEGNNTDEPLSADVVIVGLGASYKGCGSYIARTYLFQQPEEVKNNYRVLLELHAECCSVMVPGNPLSDVYHAAMRFLQSFQAGKFIYLIQHLPETLGFAIETPSGGQSSPFFLSPNNDQNFQAGMVFCLALGFQKLEVTVVSLERDETALSSTYGSIFML